MRRRISFQTYRLIDIILFLLLLIVFETLIILAYTKWFPEQPYTVSICAAITGIVYFRWGWLGGIHAMAGGILFCFLSGGNAVQFVIYGVGNLLSLLMVIPVRRFGWKSIQRDPLLCMIFGLGCTFLMQAGRAAVAMLFGYSLAVVIHFVLTDVLSGLFSMVVMWIARRLDGVLEDQKHYVLRQQEENEAPGGTET